MKYIIWFFFIVSVACIVSGYFLDVSYSQKLIGGGVVVLFFVVFPLFSYYRWKDKKVEDYMITKENIDKMIRGLKIPLGEIQYDQVVSYIEQARKKKNPLLLREISDCISIRKGKTPKAGNYIFYKTEKMSKPIFINLRKCPHDVLKDEALLIHDWVTHEYGE